MRERPIIFSAPMVRALVDGSKTQTRRAVKWPIQSRSDGSKRRVFLEADAAEVNELLTIRHAHPNRRVASPYGRPGDRLWVRETWQMFTLGDDPLLALPATPRPGVVALGYAATEAQRHRDHRPSELFTGPWRSPIFMPRWASRLTLEVVSVRVERLQDITDADARAEGMKVLSKDGGQTIKYGIPDNDGLPGTDDIGWEWRDWDATPHTAFARLWDSLNAKRGHPWDSNPWVWVIEFKRAAP